MLQEIHAGKYPGMRVAVASSADTPLAVKIGTAAMRVLEVGTSRPPSPSHLTDWAPAAALCVLPGPIRIAPF